MVKRADVAARELARMRGCDYLAVRLRTKRAKLDGERHLLGRMEKGFWLFIENQRVVRREDGIILFSPGPGFRRGRRLRFPGGGLRLFLLLFLFLYLLILRKHLNEFIDCRPLHALAVVLKIKRPVFKRRIPKERIQHRLDDVFCRRFPEL